MKQIKVINLIWVKFWIWELVFLLIYFTLPILILIVEYIKPWMN